jgi:DNA-binding GntR family transcriptional regulator
LFNPVRIKSLTANSGYALRFNPLEIAVVIRAFAPESADRSSHPIEEPVDTSQSVVESLFEKMRAHIIDGRFAPGQRLIEADLTAQFKISRGPLREAVRRLAAEGLVDITHNRGARVKRLDRSEVIALYEVREVMEGLAARLAAERANTAERTAIKAIFKDMAKALKANDVRGYIGLNSGFHALIMQAARNPALEAAIKRLQTPVLRVQFESMMTTDVASESFEEHRNIVDAIIDKNAEQAERLMRHHIRRSREMISQRQPDQFG